MRRVVLALLVGCWGTDAAAQHIEAGDGWGGSFVLENDIFEDGHDRNYTSGVLLSVTSYRGVLRGVLEDMADVTPFEDDFDDVRVEVSLSHAMFTPTDLTLVNPDPYDRPYAGMMLLTLGLVGSDPGDRSKLGDGRFDTLTYSIGVVGPSSRADDIQRWLHDEQGGVIPQGWRSQIDDRIVAGVSYRQMRRVFGGDYFDMFAHAGASLGWIQTSVSVGGTVRAGYNLPEDFGLPRIAPSLPGSGYFRTQYGHGAYVYVGGEQRYVAYDVTLDEDPRLGPNYISRRDWVGDLQAGALVYWGPLRLSYTHVWRSEQFRSQQEGDGFGAVAIGVTTRFGAGRR